MKSYSELPLTTKLLADFRSEINASKKGLGAVAFEIFDTYLEEHPEYVTYYIDLFNLCQDDYEREILSTIIINICRYKPVEDYLRKSPFYNRGDSFFEDEYKISEQEITRLLSLPKDQRLSYNPDDEAIVKERLKYFDQQIEEMKKMKI